MPDFKILQQQFSGHIRNGEVPVIPGVEARRMQVYRELFFNNIEGFTASAFPVAKRLMGEDWWHEAVRSFIKDYRAHSPYFSQISQEFLTYLNEIRLPTPEQPDFLLELMHYEWVELALETAADDPFHAPDTRLSTHHSDLLPGHPVQSPLAWSLSYRYPVHKIGPNYQPDSAPEQPTWLLVYRNRHDQIHFMEQNAMTAHLLHLLSESPQLSGQAALQQIAKAMGYSDPDTLQSAGQAILEQLLAADILLGASPLKGQQRD